MKIPEFTAATLLCDATETSRFSRTFPALDQKQGVVPQIGLGSIGLGGAGRPGFLCSGNACVCSGYDDCIGMFGGGACGGGYAKCWDRPQSGTTFCICSRS